MTETIITPWLDHSELCRMYERGVKGAEVIIIDNGSDLLQSELIEQMVGRLNGVYIRNNENRYFAPANNQGLQVATGEIVLFLNNDVELRAGFLKQVQADVIPGGLYGPSMGERHGKRYLEGWCIAGTRDTWDKLGGWPDDLPGMYWEDNILCLKAERLGLTLNKTNWHCWHANAYTSLKTPGALDHSAANQERFLEMLKE